MDVSAIKTEVTTYFNRCAPGVTIKYNGSYFLVCEHAGDKMAANLSTGYFQPIKDLERVEVIPLMAVLKE